MQSFADPTIMFLASWIGSSAFLRLLQAFKVWKDLGFGAPLEYLQGTFAVLSEERSLCHAKQQFLLVLHSAKLEP